MEKTLVIHPADASTQFLAEIYADKDWTVIDSDMSRKNLKDAIKAHDRIIMMGHGDGNGLYGFDRYIINKSFVYYLRQKYCVAIWCHASDFVYKYQLKGFYTGMIVSEYEEALMYSLYPFTSTQIEASNKLFADAIKKSIDSKQVLSETLSLYKASDNPIVHFNQNNIYYKEL